MLKQLILDADKCTSCVQCELACSLEHEGLFAPAFSRIKVFEFEHGKRNIPYTCTQCEEAWCMKACPTDAERSLSAISVTVTQSVQRPAQLAQLPTTFQRELTHELAQSGFNRQSDHRNVSH